MTERRILDGVHVLDFTHVVAGPYCTRVLADLGAEVIKVDPPPSAGAEDARSAGNVANNVGKRSIVIDLKTPPGIKVALQLAARADILVENFKPGVMAALGLGYEDLVRDHPTIIYASISGFRPVWASIPSTRLAGCGSSSKLTALTTPLHPVSRWRTL